jgi:hypothetical protein
MRRRRALVVKLRGFIPDEVDSLEPRELHVASDAFQRCVIQDAPGGTLTVMAATLHEIVAQSFTPSCIDSTVGHATARRRNVRSRRHLTQLLESGAEVAAEGFWRRHVLTLDRTLSRPPSTDGAQMSAPRELNEDHEDRGTHRRGLDFSLQG